MKQKMSIAGILLLAALGMQANNYTVKSPDGKLVVNVACERGKASYTEITMASRCWELRRSDWLPITVISQRISPWVS